MNQVNSELASQAAFLNISDTVAAQTAAIAALTTSSESIGAPTLVGAILTTATGVDPTTGDLPDGYYVMYKSSVSGLCLFANDGGVIKKVVLT